MTNVTHINPPSVQFKPQGTGLAIVRGGEVQTVLTSREVADMLPVCLAVLKGNIACKS